MEMRFVPVSKKLAEYPRLRALYQRAFPADERAPFRLLLRRAGRENTDFWALYDGAQWVGLMYLVHGEPSLSYLFYFAIDEAQRGRGCGSAALAQLRKRYAGRNVFLAIEEVDPRAENYPERVNRRRFYERSGLHALHQKLREASVVYELMGFGGAVQPEAYGAMMRRFLGWPLCRLVKMKILP